MSIQFYTVADYRPSTVRLQVKTYYIILIILEILKESTLFQNSLETSKLQILYFRATQLTHHRAIGGEGACELNPYPLQAGSTIYVLTFPACF